MNLEIKEVRLMKSGFKRKTRVYFDIKDKTIMSNITKKGYWPYDEYRKMLPEVFEKSNLKIQKASWSRRAGCSCGCHPGFILDEDKGHSVYVTI